MSLYGSDDSNANKTKAEIGVAKSSNTKTIVFIDDTEAQLKVNKDKGLSGPGWWAVDTYTDCHGKTRFKTEPPRNCLNRKRFEPGNGLNRGTPATV